MKRKQRNRKDNQLRKELNTQIESIRFETERFANYIYHQDMDKFFTSLNLALYNKINAYRLCLVLGFMFDSEKQVLRTDWEDDPENEMLTMLKGLVPSDKLVFNYVYEVEKIVEEPVEPSKFSPIM